MSNQRKNPLQIFVHAWNGLTILFTQEKNIRTHAVIGFAVILMGLFFNIERYEWIAIVGATGMVLVAESINTTIERLADHITPEQHPNIKNVKDLAAGAVLLSAIIAVIIGIIIFAERIFALII